MTIFKIFLLSSFFVVGICCKYKERKKVYDEEAFVNTSKDSNTAIISSSLNSRYFSTKGLTINALSSFSVEHREFGNFNRNERRYNFEIPITHVFFSEKSFKAGGELPSNYFVINRDTFLFTQVVDSNNVERKIRPEVSSVFSIITSSGRNYIGMFAKDMSYNNSYSNELLFLYEIDGKKVIRSLFLDDTMFATSKIFGDYNGNGFVDFLWANSSFDTIFCKEVVNNQIVVLKDKFLCVKDMDGVGQVFKVDSTRTSNWYLSNDGSRVK